MQMNMKLAVLEQLYTLYDTLLENQTVCCKRFCDACCTRNVTITTLEGIYILSRISVAEKEKLIGCLAQDRSKRRFIPQLTVNRLADCCRDGGSPPEEEVDPNWTPCSLITENECPIYRYRPFGCRCLVSTVPCRETGFAEIDPLILTINTIFQQYIEHIDAAGTTGNLIDVLLHLTAKDRNSPNEQKKIQNNINLVSNAPLRCLMIPPEHRQTVQPILDAVQQIRL